MTVILVLLVYFAPTIIAWVRHKRNPLRTRFFLNLFLGWTVIIWIILLVEALMKDKLVFGIPSRGYHDLSGITTNKNLSVGNENAISRAKAVQAVKSGGSLETYDAMVLEALKQNARRPWGKYEFKVEVDVAKKIMREFNNSNPSEADKQLVESIAQELGLYYNRFLHPFQAFKDDVKAIGGTLSAAKNVIKPSGEYSKQDSRGYSHNATQTFAGDYKQPFTRGYWAQFLPKNSSKISTDAMLAHCEQNKNRELDAIKSVMGELKQ